MIYEPLKKDTISALSLVTPFASRKAHENEVPKVLKLCDIRKWPATSLVVQWLRLCAPNAVGLGMIPGQGTVPAAKKLACCN